jgi:cell division protein YceG involved in septum cleavage
MNRPLNVRQERFCEFIASGMSGTDAYIAAGYKVSAEVAAVKACELVRKGKVETKIATLRKPQTVKALLTKDRHREILMKVAEDPNEKTQDRLRAIEIDAKLAGFFAPDQLTVDTGPNLLDEIRERANRVASILNRRGSPAEAGNGHPNANANRTSHANGLSLWNPAICARINGAQEV